MNDLIDVCVGKRFKVKMTPQVEKQFRKADAKERARCQKWMEFFANDGHDLLDDQKLKSEGRFPDGSKAGTKHQIWAFKAWQLRVYGSVVGDVFIATEIDLSKKQNDADRATLESAAKKLAQYL